MKNIFSVFALIFLINTHVFSQDVENKDREKQFTFQSSPHLLVMDFTTLTFYPYTDSLLIVVDLEGQYKINDIYNVSFTLSSWINNNNTTNDYRIDLKPMFIFRPFRTGLEGFYVGLYPTVGWYNCIISDGQNYDTLFTIVGFGMNTGYKFVFRNGFSLQLGTGMGKSWFIPDLPDSLFRDSYYLTSDIRLITKYIDFYIMDFKIGYSF